MRLYSGMSDDFIRDTTHNHIAERFREAFFAFFLPRVRAVTKIDVTEAAV